MKKVIFYFLALSFSGCVSSTKQTDHILANPLLIPTEHLIADVPFLNQETGHCGPTTLAMAVGVLGNTVSSERIASQTLTPNAKGTFQADMIGAARRQGYTAIPISDLNNLLQEIALGNVVIIFENLGLSWLPQWHYALVVGYDLEKQLIVMHSGPHSYQKTDLGEFERSWKLAHYWGLVVLKPDQLSVTSSELMHLQSAAALEELGKTSEATIAYKSILAKWPRSLGALIGLGNIYFTAQDFKNAAYFLRQATAAHPTDIAARHNLAIVEKSLRQTAVVKSR